MDRKLAGLIALFFLAFFVFVSFVVFDRPLSRFTRAKEDTQPSGNSSLLFAWPLTAKADGKQEVVIDVFVRSESNKPVPSREVAITSTLGTVRSTSATSDKTGKASFVLISSDAGIAEVGAVVDNSIPLSQKLTIKFE